MNKERKYNLVSINVRDESVQVQLNKTPLTHKEACTMKSKFTEHAHRRIQLVEISN